MKHRNCTTKSNFLLIIEKKKKKEITDNMESLITKYSNWFEFKVTDGKIIAECCCKTVVTYLKDQHLERHLNSNYHKACVGQNHKPFTSPVGMDSESLKSAR